MSVNWTLWDESPLFSFFFYSHAISWTKWVKKKKESVQLCFITHTMTPRLGKLEVARKGIDDQGRGGKGATNTSVLSLSAAKTPHRKHGHVQICLRLERPPAEMFPDLGFLNTRTRGNTLLPHGDSDVRQGHTNIESGGTNKQVAQTCESLQTAPHTAGQSLHVYHISLPRVLQRMTSAVSLLFFLHAPII